MKGPQDPAAAGRDRLRAGPADREQVIEALKTAFVQGQLTRDELDTRAGQALATRTCAELAALTADIPGGPAAAGSARPPAPVRRRPLARAAAGSGGCLVIAAAAVRVVDLADPGATPGPIPKFWALLCGLVALAAVSTALVILGFGVVIAWEQRRSCGQLPPGPGPDGHALDRERRGGGGHDPVPPGPRTDQTRTDQTRADLRAHKSSQRRRHVPARAGRAPRGARPAPGAI